MSDFIKTNDCKDKHVWEHEGRTVTTLKSTDLACKIIGGKRINTFTAVNEVIQGTRESFTRTHGDKTTTVVRYDPRKHGGNFRDLGLELCLAKAAAKRESKKKPKKKPEKKPEKGGEKPPAKEAPAETKPGAGEATETQPPEPKWPRHARKKVKYESDDNEDGDDDYEDGDTDSE